MRILHILILEIVFVFGFGAIEETQASERVTPALNEEAKAQIGEQLLHQGVFHTQAALHLTEEIEFGERNQYSLTPGYYIQTGASLDSATYSPTSGPDAGRVKKTQGAITLQGSFLYSNDGRTIAVITNFYQAIIARATGITRTTLPALSTESIQRVLVYGGMNGTKIRLAYREIWKNITRPSSDVFVEFSLADSNVIEFRGARIEVIEASGKSIRYRVIHAFDSGVSRSPAAAE